MRVLRRTFFLLFFSASVFESTAQEAIFPETALAAYLDNGDTTFHWTVRETYKVGSVNAYEILLTSQTWRDITWTHQLSVFVPDEVKHDAALLFINGGSNRDGLPRWKSKDGFGLVLSRVAKKNKAILAVLKQIPNQPLLGAGTEDALISHTLHKFKEDGDYSWPLLFPMVKGAVRAMDAVQEFAAKITGNEVRSFVVSGASKRGWTTWLTGASDPRVAAIAPMVIDILNMPVNLEYQIESWNEYSEQIEDYVKLGIPQTALTPQGQAITTMIDPYSYRRKLVMPKMIFMGTNDPYWTVDAVKHYIDSIPGTNYIHYVPNAGHGLGNKRQALAALNAFFGNTLAGRYPDLDWEVKENETGVTLRVKASKDVLTGATLWSADSDDRIFHDETWTSRKVKYKKKDLPWIEVEQSFPVSGYRAFYLDLHYRAANGTKYVKSTRMFLADNDELFLHGKYVVE